MSEYINSLPTRKFSGHPLPPLMKGFTHVLQMDILVFDFLQIDETATFFLLTKSYWQMILIMNQVLLLFDTLAILIGSSK